MKIFLLITLLGTIFSGVTGKGTFSGEGHDFNSYYSGKNLERIAFPLGGMGAGMVCLDGTGSLSALSIEHHPHIDHYPYAFAAIHIKGLENGSKVLEAPVPPWKYYVTNPSRGGKGTNYGLPRFREGRFLARFPFATLELNDPDLPVQASLTGWSPFIPGDADNSSLPVAAIEYTFKNTSGKKLEMVFSWHAENFLSKGRGGRILSTENGFTLFSGPSGPGKPRALFSVFTDRKPVTDHAWFEGRERDAAAILWKDISSGNLPHTPPLPSESRGASLFVPLTLEQGAEETVTVHFCWHVSPDTTFRAGRPAPSGSSGKAHPDAPAYPFYKPWYLEQFQSIKEVESFWRAHYKKLKKNSAAFRDAFFASTLPPEVMEAVAANLSILKSPTVLRQHDGKLWAWEGCDPESGSCYGTCTHVWNYAQALPHLFPSLERSLRETEFLVSQNAEGRQAFRSNLPVAPAVFNRPAAADGQLGGIMKVYRDWRISGDTGWLRRLYPAIRKSMDYCIATWDPRHKGVLEEPHHNTYDIQFWGPDGMCTSFYLGALSAFIRISWELNRPCGFYEELLARGKAFTEDTLFNGAYFIQKIQTKGLVAPDPVEQAEAGKARLPAEAFELLKSEGPKYQYGSGCLSDGVLGMWMASVSGLAEPLDNRKVTSHLLSVFKHNFRKDLTNHVNTQRPTYALGKEGGLLLCTWPRGNKLSLPFFYSNEVWTGIEYQVASHLIMKGEVDKGLEIVRTCRSRYDGILRNPFSEMECGYYYARAMASYSLLQALTGVRYDAVDQVLYIDSGMGDFKSFLSTGTGFGNVGLKNGEPFADIVYGSVEIQKVLVSGTEKPLMND